MPFRPTRNSRAVGVFRLMTARALQSRDAGAARPANHICVVPMPIVALLWKLCRRMAIDTARRGENRVDPLPCREAVGMHRRAEQDSSDDHDINLEARRGSVHYQFI